jgi:hypothetical protein
MLDNEGGTGNQFRDGFAGSLPACVAPDRRATLQGAYEPRTPANARETQTVRGISLEPNWDGDEEYFAPHVVAGRFVRREHAHSDGRRHAFYALPGEEWRFDAYIEMWKQADKSGWSEELERLEGHLLGYEDWQNDLYIETIYRTMHPSK